MASLRKRESARETTLLWETVPSGRPMRRLDLVDDGGVNEAKQAEADRSARKFQCMLVLASLYLSTELGIGIMSGSIALLADAFHMISDVTAIYIGHSVTRLSRKNRCATMTYGWQRAEIVGALANACFLCAVSMLISLEALEKLFLEQLDGDQLQKNANLIIGVGCMGVTINLFGVCIFGGHGHSHGGHGHSHGGHGHSHSGNGQAPGDYGSEAGAGRIGRLKQKLKTSKKSGYEKVTTESALPDDTTCDCTNSFHVPSTSDAALVPADKGLAAEPEQGGSLTPNSQPPTPPSSTSASEEPREGQTCSESTLSVSSNSSVTEGDGRCTEFPRAIVVESDAESEAASEQARQHDHGSCHSPGHGHEHRGSMNERSMLLHVIGDAMGALSVVIGAIIIKVSDSPHRFLADPICSLVIVAIILFNTLPLVKETAMILLQRAAQSPNDLAKLQQALSAVNGVHNIHELHVWQMAGDIHVCTLHFVVDCKYASEVVKIIDRLKHILHGQGIHSSTLQPEILPLDHDGGEPGRWHCTDLVCSKHCLRATCCSFADAVAS